MVQSLECPVIYLFLYKIIKEKAHRGTNFNRYISHSCLLEILHRRFNKLPNVIVYEIIKELEKLNLIKKIGATNSLRYEIVGKDKDKLLKRLNFFP